MWNIIIIYSVRMKVMGIDKIRYLLSLLKHIVPSSKEKQMVRSHALFAYIINLFKFPDVLFILSHKSIAGAKYELPKYVLSEPTNLIWSKIRERRGRGCVSFVLEIDCKSCILQYYFLF